MIWYLLLLVPVLAAAYIVWAYRRKTARRDSVSNQRYRQMFGAATSRTAAPLVDEAGRQRVPNVAASPQFSKRERLLEPQETLLYYLLKTGLPDHEVFPGVELAAVVDVTSAAGSVAHERQRRRLSQHRLDFLVCNKAMQPIAVVELAMPAADMAAAQDLKFKADCLGMAGIKYMRIEPAAIPKREDVRTIVLGE